MTIIAANLVPMNRLGEDMEECLDPTSGGELTRCGNREAFDLYAERLTHAAASCGASAMRLTAGASKSPRMNAR
jgi:hypothetical protein